MIATDSRSSVGVDSRSDGVAHLDHAVVNTALVKEYTLSLLGVGNGERRIAKGDSTRVADLTAALAVEGCFVENDLISVVKMNV